MPVDVTATGAALAGALETAVREYFEKCFTQRKFEDLGVYLEDGYRAYLPGGKEVAGIAEGGALFGVLSNITAKFTADGAAVPTVTAATYHDIDNSEAATAAGCGAWAPHAARDVRPWLCKCKITLSNGDAHPKLWLFSPGSGKLLAAWPAEIA